MPAVFTATLVNGLIPELSTPQIADLTQTLTEHQPATLWALDRGLNTFQIDAAPAKLMQLWRGLATAPLVAEAFPTIPTQKLAALNRDLAQLPTFSRPAIQVVFDRHALSTESIDLKHFQRQLTTTPIMARVAPELSAEQLAALSQDVAELRVPAVEALRTAVAKYGVALDSLQLHELRVSLMAAWRQFATFGESVAFAHDLTAFASAVQPPLELQSALIQLAALRELRQPLALSPSLAQPLTHALTQDLSDSLVALPAHTLISAPSTLPEPIPSPTESGDTLSAWVLGGAESPTKMMGAEAPAESEEEREKEEERETEKRYASLKDGDVKRGDQLGLGGELADKRFKVSKKDGKVSFTEEAGQGQAQGKEHIKKTITTVTGERVEGFEIKDEDDKPLVYVKDEKTELTRYFREIDGRYQLVGGRGKGGEVYKVQDGRLVQVGIQTLFTDKDGCKATKFVTTDPTGKVIGDPAYFGEDGEVYKLDSRGHLVKVENVQPTGKFYGTLPISKTTPIDPTTGKEQPGQARYTARDGDTTLIFQTDRKGELVLDHQDRPVVEVTVKPAGQDRHGHDQERVTPTDPSKQPYYIARDGNTTETIDDTGTMVVEKPIEGAFDKKGRPIYYVTAYDYATNQQKGETSYRSGDKWETTFHTPHRDNTTGREWFTEERTQQLTDQTVQHGDHTHPLAKTTYPGQHTPSYTAQHGGEILVFKTDERGHVVMEDGRPTSSSPRQIPLPRPAAPVEPAQAPGRAAAAADRSRQAGRAAQTSACSPRR